MAKKIMAAMSGGVDSTAAAILLVGQGFDVTGATMRLLSADTNTDAVISDINDARGAACTLGIAHVVFDVSDAFRANVITPFADAYICGRTPNPCIDCNKTVKFGVLLQKALELGMDGIATGHYARVAYDDTSGRYLLKKAADTFKDQTYMLYTLSQEQLKRTRFPLGGLKKAEARALTAAHGLDDPHRKESQDICFVPDGDYGMFLEKALGVQSAPGPFTDIDGRVLGAHKGLIHYTIGQRRGLGISADRPKYVVRKDVLTNTVVIGDEGDLYADGMTVGDINLIAVEHLSGPVQTTVKTRYSQKEASATITPLDQNTLRVRFDTPQRAVTPGQSAVFYQGDTVLGGGKILSAGKSSEEE